MEQKAFAIDAAERIRVELSTEETQYFLLCTDLSAAEAKDASRLLDETYQDLARLLDVPKDKNIWRGKAAVFVFSKRAHYRRFEKTIHETDPGKAAGMCHCLTDGTVRIAFYRQPDEKEFAHVLVHESVHGFLHRLKTPAEMPSWMDEGLAESFASKLAPQAGRAAQTLDYAKRGISLNGGLHGMLEAKQIEPWQYPVAQLLNEFLTQRNKTAYAQFITALKSGDTWEDALKSRFHLTRDELIAQFGKSIDVQDVKP